jgi:threonine dehydratase
VLIERERIDAAFDTIKRLLAPTPLVRSQYLSHRCNANVWLKLETLQPTHSFKVRGAFNAIAHLPAHLRDRGVVTASGGNHGLAVAYTAQVADIPATVYLSRKSPPDRVHAIKALGTTVVLHGESWDEANIEALTLARKTKATYIHPFDDLNVMAGQATIMCELVEQIPRIDVLVASIGGGGLLSGLISAAAAYSPVTKTIGVETEGADSMFQSWRAGRIVTLPAITSVAETLGARKTEQRQFGIITGHVSELVTVPDQDAVDALVELLAEEKLLTEPATSCSVAALLSGKITIEPGANTVIILCGANAGMQRVNHWITAAAERMAARR